MTNKMTCKDCYYNDLIHCSVPISKEYNAEEVACFKDRSRIVELPCKVGDSIYRICNKRDKHRNFTSEEYVSGDWELERIEIYEDEIVFFDDSDYDFLISDIGKTVFLTKEEAEAALKEREQSDAV